MREQNSGSQSIKSADNQSQNSPLHDESPAVNGQQGDKLRQARENGRMHQPN